MSDVDRAFDVMKNDMMSKNVVREEEFSEYLPLFDTSIQSNNHYPQEYLLNLIEKFKVRFIVNLPIEIVNAKGEVLKTIPPTFISIPAMNKVLKNPGELITAYERVMYNDAQPSHKKDAMNATLSKAVGLTLENDKGFKKSTEKVLEMTKSFDKEKSPDSNGITGGMEWS